MMLGIAGPSFASLAHPEDTMKDYAARITCLPTVEGSDLIEGDLKDG